MNIWAIIYNILIIPIIGLIYNILYLFNKKIKTRERNYKQYLNKIPPKSKDKLRILFHSSSMGEFEQAKPLIERLKRKSPNIEIIASFYSPSGFDNQKNYKFIDYIIYMPFDSFKKAKIYTKKTNPDIAVFIRYDIWRNHIAFFKYYRKPLILINASKPSSIFAKFPIIKSFFKDIYSLFDEIYTLGQSHTEYFNKLNIRTKIFNSADTRYDRIMEKVSENINSDILDNELFNGKRVLVLGSSWREEEEIISKCFNQFKDKIFLIIVPHEPTKEHINKTKTLFPNHLLLSDYNQEYDYETEVLIVDSIGKLLALYSFADVAIVGGGFGKSVHSLSEPAGYSIPLACGPNIDRSPEAAELIDKGGLVVLKELNDCIIFLNTILDKNKAQRMGLISGNFIKDKIGSSNIITKKILTLAEGKNRV